MGKRGPAASNQSLRTNFLHIPYDQGTVAPGELVNPSAPGAL
jgi:hypothetical protein